MTAGEAVHHVHRKGQVYHLGFTRLLKLLEIGYMCSVE